MKRLKALLTGLALGTLIGSLIDPERRAKARQIAKELKVKVGGRAKAISGLSRDAYENLVETAAEEYRGAKSVTREDLDKIVAELKAGWEEVRQTFKR